MRISFFFVFEAVENIDVFQCIETAVALQLIDLLIGIDVELIFSEYGNGGRLCEGEDRFALLTFVDHDAVAVQRNLRIFFEEDLILIDDDLRDVCVFAVHRCVDILTQIEIANEILLIFVPIVDESEGKIAVNAAERRRGVVARETSRRVDMLSAEPT